MTLYEILEVSEKASTEVIDKAYKVLAKRYHPDLQTNSTDKIKAEEMMKKINSAYDILNDSNKRTNYDNELCEERRKIEQEKSANMEQKQQQQYVQHTQYTQYTQQQKQQEQYENNYADVENNQTSNNQADNTHENDETNWQDQMSQLSKKEQRKLKRKIEKNAEQEYREIYENYLRGLGYRVKHRVTFKEILSIIILMGIISLTLWIMWLIPSTHEWMNELYNTNILIKVLTDVIHGIFIGIIESFKNIGSFNF